MKLSKEIKIGIAGLIALGILIFGVNYLKGMNIFRSSTHYYVKFGTVNGLPKSSPVMADGYRIGTVSDIIYDYKHPGNVVVEISVSPSLRVPKGSTAELSKDLLGAISMTLLLANNPRERVENGDTIPGKINGGLLSQAGDMVPQIEQLVPKLDSILTALNRLLQDGALASTLRNVEALSGNLERSSRNLEGMLKNDLPKMVQNVGTITENFAQISANLKETDYAGMMRKVDETLESVGRLTASLESEEGSLGLLLKDRGLYDNLNQTSKNAALLLEDLQAHPKRYVHFSLFGKKDN